MQNAYLEQSCTLGRISRAEQCRATSTTRTDDAAIRPTQKLSYLHGSVSFFYRAPNARRSDGYEYG